MHAYGHMKEVVHIHTPVVLVSFTIKVAQTSSHDNVKDFSVTFNAVFGEMKEFKIHILHDIN